MWSAGRLAGMITFLFLILLIILILLGTPIGFAMAILPAIYIAFTDAIPLTPVPCPPQKRLPPRSNG